MTQEDRNRAERKLHTAARIACRHLPSGLPPILYLTDPDRTPDPVLTAGRLTAGWGVVLRHYGQHACLQAARSLAEVCRNRHVSVLVANDPILAMEIGADGVHWPFASRRMARRWRARFTLMTVSAHSPRELRLLNGRDFDAALVSTAFPSASPSASRPLGATRFRSLARTAPVPVYALGGLNADTANTIASVAGIAAIEGLEAVFGPRI